MPTHVLHSGQLALKRNGRRSRVIGVRRPRFGIIACAGLVLGFGILLLAEAKTPGPDPVPAVAAAAVAPPPVWVDIIHPIQFFDLSAPELAKTTSLYEARHNQIGGGREDILTFGQLNEPTPYVRFVLYRVGAEKVPDTGFYVDLARTAAQAELSIRRSLTPAELPTRFGAFEAANVDLAGNAVAAVPCLGFRGAALAGQFRILGFACGGKAQPISRPALACLIDRLDLNDAGDDKALAAFFAQSELKRDPACLGTRLGPTAARASWLDQNDARPPLKRKKRL